MVMCGNIPIDNTYVQIIRIIVMFLKIVAPIILVIMGMLDFVKVLVSKDAKIGDGFKTFFLRLVSATLLYFIVPIVELLLNIVISTGVIDKSYNCVRCLAENECN